MYSMNRQVTYLICVGGQVDIEDGGNSAIIDILVL